VRLSPLLLAGALLASGACASHPAPSRAGSAGTTALAPAAEVVFDLASSCPRVVVDRAGRSFSVAASVDSRDATSLVVVAQGNAATAWRREFPGRAENFAVSAAQLGEGLAVAGAASEPDGGLFVVSLSATGATRFTRRIAALGGAGAGDEPHVTAVVLGPHSEITVAGTTRERLDFGVSSVAPGASGYDDDRMLFVARYAPDGALVFSAARKAKLGTLPRLVAMADGAVAVAFDARGGKPSLEWLDGQGHGSAASLALSGTIRAMTSSGRDEVVLATQRAEDRTGAPVIELARLTRRGGTIRATTIPGELQDGALAVRANGDLWFGGWFDGAPAGCASPPSSSDGAGRLPRLQIVSADGRRCRSLPVATRDARWTTPASLVETPRGRMLYATPYLGVLELPGVPPRSSGTGASRCALVALPADAVEYTP
jgi:hypothetical protein